VRSAARRSRNVGFLFACTGRGFLRNNPMIQSSQSAMRGASLTLLPTPVGSMSAVARRCAETALIFGR
jgi:hypothetical protein